MDKKIQRNLSFDSWESFLAAATADTGGPYYRKESGAHGAPDYGMGATWYGSDSFDHALALARHWPEGTKQIEQMAKSISAKASLHVERTAFEFATHDGNSFDIGRFLRGEPECVLRMVRKQTHGKSRKVIRLVMNISASCGVDTAVMIRRGAAMCAAAYCLHHAGYGTELRVVECSYSPTHEFQWSVLIKRASSNFDLGRIAFACAHPSMLRRLGFALLENQGNEFHAGIGSGYGTPSSAQGITADILLDKAHSGDAAWQSIDSATAWVLESLKTQGIELKA